MPAYADDDAAEKTEYGLAIAKIDDRDATRNLLKAMEVSLPIDIRVSQSSKKEFSERAGIADDEHGLQIEDIFYSGDFGGILCVLSAGSKPDTRQVVSLTHLEVDPRHPLASQISNYQKRRILHLAIIDKRSQPAKEKRKKKGFMS